MILVADLDQTMQVCQKKQKVKLEEWRDKHQLEQRENIWYREQVLVVTSNEEDHRALLEVYHDALMARHLGAAKML
jgi:hypothetical protein